MLAARVTSKPQALRQLKQFLLHISSQEVSAHCCDYRGPNRQIKGCLLLGWSMSSCSVLLCHHLSRPTSRIFSPDSLKKRTAQHCNYPAYSQSNFTATAGLSSLCSAVSAGLGDFTPVLAASHPALWTLSPADPPCRSLQPPCYSSQLLTQQPSPSGEQK